MVLDLSIVWHPDVRFFAGGEANGKCIDKYHLDIYRGFIFEQAIDVRTQYTMASRHILCAQRSRWNMHRHLLHGLM